MDDLPPRGWCLSCLHTSIANYDPQLNKPFQVHCTINEDANNPFCGQCSARKIICEPPALGMLGDMYDLCAILQWAGRFWSPRELLYWNLSFHLAVCEASKELCLKFEDAESSHRRFHMLSAIGWEDPSEEQNADIDDYRRFLADRRDVLDVFTTPLTRTIDRQDWVVYNAERLLRLWKGDAGFLEWSEAKTAFLDHILRKSILIYGGEGSKLGRERQVSIEDSFPVTVE